ncbi:hypothetical protein PPMP20_11385 [Paraburkholderia phymatum]|uniref:hypothetical protein n=1 Tax=Paraburkholderia phymatum TaxID=148447 RepID=UPI0002E54AE7|nr:hypothetical protein [Paraburkholderia phymatum]
MVDMVMSAVGYHTGNAAGNAGSVARHVRTPMLLQKLVGLAILGSGYVAIVATLVHAISG